MAATGLICEVTFNTCVRGYHIYQDEWTPVLDETLSCCRELANIHDPFAIKVMKAGTIVGHLPKKISSTCSLFILKGGIISCNVTDPNRKYSRDLAQGGLEIPCVITLRGTKELVDKAKKLLALSNESVKSTGEQNCKNPEKKQVPISLSATLEPNPKRIKLEQTDKDLNQRLVWVMFPSTRIQLFSEDKLVIEGQCQLNDRHINFVQAMLRAQFPKCDGLQNTLLQNQVRLTIAHKMVQILHVRNNHWVVISNVHCSGDDLKMYDTVYDDIDSSTMALLNSMFEENINVSMVPRLQKQKGDVDCGIFSTAIATSLLHGLSPGPYKQSLLRPHLISCFENKEMTPFP